MTSRYSLHTVADLRERFSLSIGLPKGIKPSYNIHPTSQAPVVLHKDTYTVVEQMSWGLVPKGTKNTNTVFRYKTHTVPSEKILTKHSWETAVRYNRCLVPANGFYQLEGKGDEKQAYYIQIKDAPIFAFAGIYSSWEEEGATYASYSIITTEASYEPYNSSGRMPIILSQSDEARWLDTSITDANALFDMLRPTSNQQLLISQVSPDIHSLKIDSPKLIMPL